MKALAVMAAATLALIGSAAVGAADEVEEPACITCWGVGTE